MVKTVFFLATGSAFLIRGLFRPVRAVVKNGEIQRCSGRNSYGVCDPSIGLRTAAGEPAMATTSGKVVAKGKNYIHIQSRNEPVILMYHGVIPSVKVGQYVGVGQLVGKSEGKLSFSVTQFGPGGVRSVPPSAWLISRGQKPVARGKENQLWCSGHREINVPREAKNICNFKTPEKASYALLPVSVEMN